MLSRVTSAGWYGLGLFVAVALIQAQVGAAPVAVAPEIDSGSIAAGVGLLSGAALMLKARRRAK